AGLPQNHVDIIESFRIRGPNDLDFALRKRRPPAVRAARSTQSLGNVRVVREKVYRAVQRTTVMTEISAPPSLEILFLIYGFSSFSK
ncbi:unnamed protein product, partial [Ixodes persulcatus]